MFKTFKTISTIMFLCLILSGCKLDEEIDTGFVFDSLEQKVTEYSENIETEVDETFLEEHIYGNWELMNRVVKYDESEDEMLRCQSNFSEHGVDELYGLIISYSKEGVQIPGLLPLGNNSLLSNPNDVYLFGLYGGFNAASNPRYYMLTMPGEEIQLFQNQFMIYNEQYIQIFNEKFIKKVYYNLGNDTNANGEPYLYRRCIGDILYVADETDQDTLYLDFCGIWELKRVNGTGQETGGKQPIG